VSRSNEFRVGVLVIVAIVATSAWLFILKEYKFKRATYPIYVDYARVAGIKSGADVTIRGVSKGEVGEVKLERDHVRLTLEIEEGTFIARDARFIIHSDLINPSSIRIEQGGSETALAPRAEIRGMEMVGLASVLEGGSSLLTSLQILAQRFDSLTAGGRLDRMMAAMEDGAEGLEAWTAEGRKATKRALDRVEKLAASLEEIMAENREPLNEALTGVGQASVRADSLAAQVGELVESLRGVTGRLENGEGSLGKALEDDELYWRLSGAVARLDSLSKDIQENPKRYFHFSIF